MKHDTIFDDDALLMRQVTGGDPELEAVDLWLHEAFGVLKGGEAGRPDRENRDRESRPADRSPTRPVQG